MGRSAGASKDCSGGSGNDIGNQLKVGIVSKRERLLCCTIQCQWWVGGWAEWLGWFNN